MTESIPFPVRGTLAGKPDPRHAPQTACKWAFISLLFFTVAVFARPEDIFPALGQLHLTLVFGCCAAMTYLGALLTRRTSCLWSAELRLVLLLTAWYVAGVPFAFWRGGSVQVLLGVWLKTLVIFFLLTQTLLTLKRIYAVLWAIILSELAVTAFTILQPSKAVWVGGRMAGVSQGILGWNFLGVAAAITLPYLCAFFVLRRSLVTSALLAATSFSMLWMLVLTASRSGVMDVLVALILTVLLVVRGNVRGRIVGVGIAVVLLVSLSLAPMIFWQRLSTVLDTSNILTSEEAASAAESTEDHLAVLNRSIQYTLEYPVFGLGLGNFQVANGTDLARPSAWMGTHNTFTQISSEAGIPALLLFLALLALAMRNMRRASFTPATDASSPEVQLLSRATLASLLSFVFAAFFAHLAYDYYCFYPVAIAVGIQHASQQPTFDPALGPADSKHSLIATEMG